MAKRFTDNEKWKKRFFKNLEPKYKLLWIYILDDCNHAGIWDVDMDVAALRIGESLNEKKALELFNGNVLEIRDDRWFVPDFITFQYGELNNNSRGHQSVIALLNKHNIDYTNKPEQLLLEKPTKFKKPDIEEIKTYCKSRNNKVDGEQFLNYYESKGWKIGKTPMKNWKAAIRTWEKNEFKTDKKQSKVKTNLDTWHDVKSILKNK